ncbi:Calmodulin binding protein-like protein [Cynara cardunculus var. scolymus]|uniref:Calmodulin binding protein-like protein n=1 Tax=Cynara cardunculus var. scolymus TaxID=59895 RepID=A0A124SGG3_CYNCS|nr:Calmodulin binding protein-like protein [Cynara cardunculus var. scolymus]
MAFDRQRLEEGNTGKDGSELNGISTDDLAAFSGLRREALEVMILQTLKRLDGPTLVTFFGPSIRQIVREEFALAQQELLTSKKEIPVNKASTSSVLKNLKTQFRTRVSQPVFTGMPLVGENKTPIEIALVDADTEQIVNTGTESALKLEIVGCRVGDDDCEKRSWTFEELQNSILGEKKGKRILQGDTCVQLKEGIGFVGEISFTFNSTHTKNGWYKLGAIVGDAALMNGVEVAWTESFLVKDRRATYSVKHPCPSLFDKVCHLQQISYCGNRYKRLKDAGVNTVKDLLTLLHTDPERLKDVEAKKLIKFACEHLEVLLPVKDETSLIEHLQSGTGFSSLPSNQSLGTSMINDTSSRATCSFPSLIGAPDNLDSSNLHTGESTNQAPAVTSQSERGKEKAPFDDELIYCPDDYQEHFCFHPSDLEGPNENHAHYPPTETGTSFSPLLSSNQSSIDRPRRPSECNIIVASHKKRRFDYPQIAYSPEMDMQYLLESWICDSSQDVDMQYSGRCDLEVDQACALAGFSLSSIVKAQRRWKIVSSVVEWFSLMSEIRKRDVIKPCSDGNMVGVIAAGFN